MRPFALVLDGIWETLILCCGHGITKSRSLRDKSRRQPARNTSQITHWSRPHWIDINGYIIGRFPTGSIGLAFGETLC